MTSLLVRWIARQPRGLAARIALGLAPAALALGVRLALLPWMGPGAPFAAFVLAVLVAAVFGGVLSGAVATAALAAGGVLLLAPPAHPTTGTRVALGLLFFLASSAFVVWIVTLLRAALARETAAHGAERLLKQEMHHRVKNTLAVVQSLADQTFRGATDAEAARRQFADRLTALAQAHDLLLDAGWGEVTVAALADRALAPFRPADAGRLTLDGPSAHVSPEAAVALTLCLHELATNAAKHGALSDGAGQVAFAWRIEAPAPGLRRLHVAWRETGGPAPAPSGRTGFGSRLLTRALAAQPNAESRLELPPEGARWTAAFDV